MLHYVMAIKSVRLFMINKTVKSWFKGFLVAELTPLKQQVFGENRKGVQR